MTVTVDALPFQARLDAVIGRLSDLAERRVTVRSELTEVVVELRYLMRDLVVAIGAKEPTFVELTCLSCGRGFRHERRPGRRPLLCEHCR